MDDEQYTSTYFIVEQLRQLREEIKSLNNFVRDHMEKEENEIQHIRSELDKFKWRVYGGLAVGSFVFSLIVNFGMKIALEKFF